MSRSVRIENKTGERAIVTSRRVVKKNNIIKIAANLFSQKSFHDVTMDEIAEKGYAAHWKYKDNNQKSQESGLEEWIRRVRDMLDQSESTAIEFVDDFRHNLFYEEVYVFTPKGDLKILPHGSTALDFAFFLHTDFGNNFIKAIDARTKRALGKAYELKHRDALEIVCR